MWTWPDCVRRRGWDPSQKVAGPDEGQVDSMRLETCIRLVQEAACEDAVAAYVDAAGFFLPKWQCKVCLEHCNTRITYCTCGHLKGARARQREHQRARE